MNLKDSSGVNNKILLPIIRKSSRDSDLNSIAEIISMIPTYRVVTTFGAVSDNFNKLCRPLLNLILSITIITPLKRPNKTKVQDAPCHKPIKVIVNSTAQKPLVEDTLLVFLANAMGL